MRQKLDDPHDQTITEESENTDDKHTGNDQVSFRHFFCFRDHRSLTDSDACHFTDHEKSPSKSDCDTKTPDNSWKRCRKDNLP